MSTPKLSTFSQFAMKYPVYTESGLRWKRFCSRSGRKNSRGEQIPPNGFADAFVEDGGRVFIDEDRFFEKIYGSQER